MKVFLELKIGRPCYYGHRKGPEITLVAEANNCRQTTSDTAQCRRNYSSLQICSWETVAIPSDVGDLLLFCQLDSDLSPFCGSVPKSHVKSSEKELHQVIRSIEGPSWISCVVHSVTQVEICKGVYCTHDMQVVYWDCDKCLARVPSTVILLLNPTRPSAIL